MLKVRRGTTIGVTGASGYLGGTLLKHFNGQGFRTVAYTSQVRSDLTSAASEVRVFDLARGTHPDLSDIEILIHCAHEVRSTLVRRWRLEDDVNVTGLRVLLESARKMGIHRLVLISSIAAYSGTTQRYGRVKLKLEELGKMCGAVIVRPGLIYGPDPGGVVGALDRLVQVAPVLPAFMGNPLQYVVHIDDLVEAIGQLGQSSRSDMLTICAQEPVTFRELLIILAARHHRSASFIPVPWRPFYFALRVAEHTGMALPFRADSLRGLCHPLPAPDLAPMNRLGIGVRPFAIF